METMTAFSTSFDTCSAAHRAPPDDLDRGVLFLEVARAAHDGAGGAHAGDKVGDPALGVAPDFRAGGAVVRLRIIGIGELVENLADCLLLPRNRQIARPFHSRSFS